MRHFTIVALFALALPLFGFSCSSSRPTNPEAELAELKVEFANICNSFAVDTDGEAVCLVDFEKQTLHLALTPAVAENEVALETLAVTARTFCRLTLNKGTVYLGFFGTPMKELPCNGNAS